MSFPFTRITYKGLTSRQQENYNFQKISAVLAEFGFATFRLTADWNGADFLAHHLDGETLRIPLKGRLAFDKKYQGKEIWIAFPKGDHWNLYPHDVLLEQFLAGPFVGGTTSWNDDGGYSFRVLSKRNRALLESYRLTR